MPLSAAFGRHEVDAVSMSVDSDTPHAIHDGNIPASRVAAILDAMVGFLEHSCHIPTNTKL